MTTQTETPTLNSLNYLPYLNEMGTISEELQGKIGVYAIFDQEKSLQFAGYSRDIFSSLKQHLVRQPNNCHWIKVQTITRPSRTILEEIKNNWIAENGNSSLSNEDLQAAWTQPIDAKLSMTEQEKETYKKGDELSQIKLLKNIARRVQAEIEATLKQRSIQMEIRFNPKLKEQGLLDLK
ncbi:MAG: GIY-YIG nuclease family protein [Cyanobacteria bacterium P01_G01_bin.49]